MNTKVVIVGAGIAGLTLGYKLAERGIDVLVLEKEQRVGGLARSFSYGNYTFDIGPHSFFLLLMTIILMIGILSGWVTKKCLFQK